MFFTCLAIHQEVYSFYLCLYIFFINKCPFFILDNLLNIYNRKKINVSNDKNVISTFSELALVKIYEKPSPQLKKRFTIKDIVGDGFLLAVPKFRRTIEKKWKRKFGYSEYVWKMLVPKTNIIVCNDCGHHHERGRLCGNKHLNIYSTSIHNSCSL